jgi:hypothetical protein
MTYPSRLVTVGLASTRLNAFTLGSHSFVRLGADSAKGTHPLPAGFYEMLLGGPISLVVRRTKIYQAKAQQHLQFGYKQTNKLFGKTATTTSEVTSLKKLLALLPAHRADVQQYARLHKLSFSENEREASAIKALLYYYAKAKEQ